MQAMCNLIQLRCGKAESYQAESMDCTARVHGLHQTVTFRRPLNASYVVQMD
jgi:hypothetical protein